MRGIPGAARAATVRLNRWLAVCGVASRRAADAMIAAGRVALNGTVVTELGTQVDPHADRVAVDGAEIRAAEPTVHLLLHKPVGTITTARDPEGRPTVLGLVPKDLGRLYPVGRLDYDTSGLLLLTNDGKLAHRLTHPRYGVEKVYRARVDRAIAAPDLARIRAGVPLEDGMTSPAGVRVPDPGRPELVEVAIHEGRNRQIRRVLEFLGYRVVALARIRFGGLTLGEVRPGAWRRLTAAEVIDLRRKTGLLNG